MTDSFDNLWDYATRKLGSKVQNREELFALHSVMKALNLDSYLEIGASLGGSLVVLASAVRSSVVAVDLFEPHSRATLEKALSRVRSEGKLAVGIAGDSRNPQTLERVVQCGKQYDAVLIDGGHDYDTVRSDLLAYGPLASKLLVFHDITMPDVRRVWLQSGGGLEIIAPRSTMGFGLRFMGGGQ